MENIHMKTKKTKYKTCKESKNNILKEDSILEDDSNRNNISTDNKFIEDNKSLQIPESSINYESDINNINDLCLLKELSIENILQHLEYRYNRNITHTYVGPMIITLNPYTYFNDGHVVNASISSNINKQTDSINKKDINTETGLQNNDIFYNPPTTYTNTGYNYIYEMFKDIISSIELYKNQVVIITGESGSGKTVNTKIAMDYLLSYNKSNETTNSNNSEDNNIDINYTNNLNICIENIHPILEAFGNAKTTLNDNSSRFGKLIKIFYKKNNNNKSYSDYNITGLKIETYLLEKSRVTHQNINEFNYHIFYYTTMYYGINISDNRFISFDDNTEEVLFNKQYCIDNFKEVETALEKLNMDIEYVFNVIKCILYLGNIKVLENTGQSNSNITFTIKINEEIEFISSVLKYSDANSFVESLLIDKLVISREIITKHNDKNKIEEKIESISKNLYNGLFNHIIDNINSKLTPDDNLDGNSISDISDNENIYTISLVDIYGFEDNKNNDIEQFCINWANEKIQNEFIKDLFGRQLQKYKDEGIDIDLNGYSEGNSSNGSNTGIIYSNALSLIENKCGIVDLVDEECRLNGKVENLFVKINNFNKSNQSLVGLFKGYGNSNISSSNVSNNSSNVSSNNNNSSYKSTNNPLEIDNFYLHLKHYAGTIKYSLDNFLIKNRDKDSIDVIFKDIKNRKPGHKTILSSFKDSLNSLFSFILQSKVYYIRSIKPNNLKIFSYNKELVKNQLMTTGIVSVIETSKNGYFYDIEIDMFKNRYSDSIKYIMDNYFKDNCSDSLEILTKHIDMKIGKTKVFLKNNSLKILEDYKELIFRNKRIISESIRLYLNDRIKNRNIIGNYIKRYYINYNNSKNILSSTLKSYLFKKKLSISTDIISSAVKCYILKIKVARSNNIISSILKYQSFKIRVNRCRDKINAAIRLYLYNYNYSKYMINRYCRYLLELCDSFNSPELEKGDIEIVTENVQSNEETKIKEEINKNISTENLNIKNKLNEENKKICFINDDECNISSEYNNQIENELIQKPTTEIKMEKDEPMTHHSKMISELNKLSIGALKNKTNQELKVMVETIKEDLKGLKSDNNNKNKIKYLEDKIKIIEDFLNETTIQNDLESGSSFSSIIDINNKKTCNTCLDDKIHKDDCCKNCKTIETKYKIQTEELKKIKNNDTDKIISELQNKIKHLESQVKDDEKKEIQDNNMFANYAGLPISSHYDIFSCLIELYINESTLFDNYKNIKINNKNKIDSNINPSHTTLPFSNIFPKDEIYSLSYIAYNIIIRLRNNRKEIELFNIFISQLEGRIVRIENNIEKIAFILVNTLEIKKIINYRKYSKLKEEKDNEYSYDISNEYGRDYSFNKYIDEMDNKINTEDNNNYNHSNNNNNYNHTTNNILSMKDIEDISYKLDNLINILTVMITSYIISNIKKYIPLILEYDNFKKNI
ncbi:Myosin heavy chain, partial [Spraguea lophii 42_110]